MTETSTVEEQSQPLPLVNGTIWTLALAQGSITSSTLYFFLTSNLFLFFIGLIGHVTTSWVVARHVQLATSDETTPPKHALHNLLMLIIFVTCFIMPNLTYLSPLATEFWACAVFVLVTLSNRFLVKTVYTE